MKDDRFSNIPEDEDCRQPVRKLKARSHAGATIAVCIIIILGLASFAFIALVLTQGIDFLVRDDETAPPETTAPLETAPVTEEETESEEEKITELYDMQQYDEEMIGQGELILVNPEHEYSFYVPEKDIVSVYDNKSSDYLVSDTNLRLRRDVITALNDMMSEFKADTGHSDVMLRTGYRDKATQEKLYSDKVSAVGEEEALKTVSPAGHSDYHLATSFYAVIYNDGAILPLERNAEYSTWLLENCHKYGFIRRFPPDKSDKTGFAIDEWHFRYIGAPHAEIMYKEELCLEEYIEYLRGYPVSGEHLIYSCEDGSEYEIYFSPANLDKPSYLPLPKSGEYTVSGNNIDGYIVAHKTK